MALRICAKEFSPGLRGIYTTSLRAADKYVKRFDTPGPKESIRPELGLFKTINRLARERKWNGLEHKPVSFLYGEDGKKVYALYLDKFYNPKFQRFCERWALGKEIQAVLTLIGLALSLIIGIEIYNFFVPETFRFGYKYGIKQQLEEKHKHGDNHEHH